MLSFQITGSGSTKLTAEIIAMNNSSNLLPPVKTVTVNNSTTLLLNVLWHGGYSVRPMLSFSLQDPSLQTCNSGNSHIEH